MYYEFLIRKDSKFSFGFVQPNQTKPSLILYFEFSDNVTMIDPTDLQRNSSSEDDCTKPRKKHVKIAKEKYENYFDC